VKIESKRSGNTAFINPKQLVSITPLSDGSQIKMASGEPILDDRAPREFYEAWVKIMGEGVAMKKVGTVSMGNFEL
jgi:hypothetical protein